MLCQSYSDQHSIGPACLTHDDRDWGDCDYFSDVYAESFYDDDDIYGYGGDDYIEYY
jgi:hypothetical protein